MRWDFSKQSQISEGRLPPEDVSVWLGNLWTCLSDDVAKILFPGCFWMRWDLSKKHLKSRKVVYPLWMSPYGLEICGRVFKTILQKYL